MKTQVQLVNLENPITMIRTGFIAMILVLFTSMAVAQTTVVEIIVNSPDHTTLEAAVIAAELDDDLSGEGPFTVFAPTDAAFDALPEGTVDALLADPTGTLADILLYHVLTANVSSAEAKANQGDITMANGQLAGLKYFDDSLWVNDDSRVIIENILADNGTIHVVDTVILQPWPRD